MRIPMYSVMGGAPVGMQSAYKRGCTGTGNRQIFYISVLWPLNADLAERLSFCFPRLYASHIPHKMACMRPFMVRMHNYD